MTKNKRKNKGSNGDKGSTNYRGKNSNNYRRYPDGGKRRPESTERRFKRGERIFPKFADNQRRNNDSVYWDGSKFADNERRNNESVYWNGHNNRNDNYNGNGSLPDVGIYPWIRQKPVNPLVIPQHLQFETKYDIENKDENHNKNIVKGHSEGEPPNKLSECQGNLNETNVCMGESDPLANNKPVLEAEKTSKPSAESNFAVNIKKEKDLSNVKQEKHSSTSSSSSSSESSSSEEESANKCNAASSAKQLLTSCSKQQSPSLNIKVKPEVMTTNSTPVTGIIKSTNEHSSSSSSSSCSDEKSVQITATVDTLAENNKSQVLKNDVKKKASKKKIGSEDDVVCIGNLENKIVLEEESDSDKAMSLNESSSAKTEERCMLCDKKGHTSFQCQMICKNCSAPYHGYRTCPEPANLNIMMQLFLEFCMQQFHNFSTEKHIAASTSKHKDDSIHLINTSDKYNKLKRKKIKENEHNSRAKVSKKRKISKKERKSNTNSDDSRNDDNVGDGSSSETSSTETEDVSNSSPERLVYSKKRKIKNRNASKMALSSSNFSTNPVNLPIVLNGFPNLTVPTASIQNPNTSASALNTLLLTQMFQNAIGSFKK